MEKTTSPAFSPAQKAREALARQNQEKQRLKKIQQTDLEEEKKQEAVYQKEIALDEEMHQGFLKGPPPRKDPGFEIVPLAEPPRSSSLSQPGHTWEEEELHREAEKNANLADWAKRDAEQYDHDMAMAVIPKSRIESVREYFVSECRAHAYPFCKWLGGVVLVWVLRRNMPRILGAITLGGGKRGREEYADPLPNPISHAPGVDGPPTSKRSRLV